MDSVLAQIEHSGLDRNYIGIPAPCDSWHTGEEFFELSPQWLWSPKNNWASYPHFGGFHEPLATMGCGSFS